MLLSFQSKLEEPGDTNEQNSEEEGDDDNDEDDSGSW